MRLLALPFGHVGLGLWMALALAGCGKKAESKVTRADCEQVAEHIAALIIADANADPDGLWNAIHATPGDTGIPADVQKPMFKAWLGSPQGKTWMMQRHGQTLSGTQQAIEPCVEKATKRDVTCLLAAKSKADVKACDPSTAKK